MSTFPKKTDRKPVKRCQKIHERTEKIGGGHRGVERYHIQTSREFLSGFFVLGFFCLPLKILRIIHTLEALCELFQDEITVFMRARLGYADPKRKEKMLENIAYEVGHHPPIRGRLELGEQLFGDDIRRIVRDRIKKIVNPKIDPIADSLRQRLFVKFDVFSE